MKMIVRRGHTISSNHGGSRLKSSIAQKSQMMVHRALLSSQELSGTHITVLSCAQTCQSFSRFAQNLHALVNRSTFTMYRLRLWTIKSTLLFHMQMVRCAGSKLRHHLKKTSQRISTWNCSQKLKRNIALVSNYLRKVKRQLLTSITQEVTRRCWLELKVDCLHKWRSQLRRSSTRKRRMMKKIRSWSSLILRLKNSVGSIQKEF